MITRKVIHFLQEYVQNEAGEHLVTRCQRWLYRPKAFTIKWSKVTCQNCLYYEHDNNH